MPKEGLGKRGAESSAAASVIGFITLMLVFYIILIPPAEREALLSEPGPSTNATTPTTARSLLLATVGHLEPSIEQPITHPLPDLFLTEATEAKTIATFNPFRVTAGLFSAKPVELTFVIDDLSVTDNAIFTFTPTEFQGTLTIKLNGIPISSEAHTTSISTPIQLRKDLLQNRNTITLTTSRPGLAFWRTNTYAISNAQVLADITDVKKQESINTFDVPSTEYGNIGRATMDFIPVCDQRNTGTLTIKVNGNTVYSAIPACESQNRLEFGKENIVPGKNTVTFRAESGSYRLEQMRVQLIPKQPDRVLKFFTIDQQAMDAIRAGKRAVFEVEFVDDGTTKRAITNVNGRLDSIEQRDPRFVRDITPVIRLGNNYVDLVPKSSLDVVKLEVRLE